LPVGKPDLRHDLQGKGTEEGEGQPVHRFRRQDGPRLAFARMPGNLATAGANRECRHDVQD
jgi:hypothetical protein